ncbi:MAG: hydroxymethylbilane synthase [Acidobacteriota bacterium]|nr:hydroxymethylbilane synthase [Acidobacteriota bacterium]
MTRLKLGTRGSKLALWQAKTVAATIRDRTDQACELVVISTTGDQLANANLSTVGGKRVFVKEIEHALIRGSIDLAVHSAKDMPAEIPEGLVVRAVLPREDPRDALILPADGPYRPGRSPEETMASQGSAPAVGSGSVRRVAQLTRCWPHARFRLVRGNVGTRLAKLDAGRYDMLVLAAAGLRRLGLANRISNCLNPDLCVPSPGQGIIAIESRADDVDTARALSAINDEASWLSLAAERELVSALGGGCQVPIGALARWSDDGDLRLSAVVASLDGTQLLRREAATPVDPDPRRQEHGARQLGARVAGLLLGAGAGPILESARRETAPIDADAPPAASSPTKGTTT